MARAARRWAAWVPSGFPTRYWRDCSPPIRGSPRTSRRVPTAIGSVVYPGQTPRIYWNFANTQTGNIDSTYANGPSFAKYDSVGTSITLDWQINNDLKFKSITGWRQINWNIGTDLDGEPESMQEVTDSQHQHQISQEFQLNGKASTIA